MTAKSGTLVIGLALGIVTLRLDPRAAMVLIVQMDGGRTRSLHSFLFRLSRGRGALHLMRMLVLMLMLLRRLTVTPITCCVTYGPHRVSAGAHRCVAPGRPLDQPWLLHLLLHDYQVLGRSHLRHEVTIALFRVLPLLPRYLKEVLAQSKHLAHITRLKNPSR